MHFNLANNFHKNGENEKALTLAVIRQESAFDPQAVSPAGAMGLMQLMPSTGKHVANSLKMKFQNSSLQNPTTNIRLGQAYLDSLIRQWGGSYILAIASYNAGASRVSEWIDINGDPRDNNVDPVEWIERIPFSETRNYVQRVLENLQVYRARLQGNKSTLFINQDLKRG